MSSLNGVTYICSAGLSSVTSAGTLGPYFSLTYFLPVYDFRIDKTICDTSAIGISSLNYTSATHSSLSGLEIIYNNPELSGQGSYNILNFNSMYSRGTSGSGPLFTNTRQRNGDNKINVLNGKVLQNQVSATGFSNVAAGRLSATGSYTSLTGTSVNSWNPLSAASKNWNYQNLFRVTSYSPNQSTSGIASGNYKCRIPAGTGSFKFNMLAIYATRVNQYGYADPGVVGSPYNPTLFAIVVFDTPQVKSDTVGSLNAFEANVELTFGLASSAATPIYINTDYFTRVPTSNTTSAYALNYDGDVVISSSAAPGSWVPRAKLTVTDPEKTQVRLSHDDTRYTNISTNRFKPYSSFTQAQEMAVLDVDTSCPDDALLQLGYNCVATGIKSIAMGCYSSATGFDDSYLKDFGQTNPDVVSLYNAQRGGYTLAIGVENISQGLLSTSLGYQTSSIGYCSFAGGFASVASSEGSLSNVYGVDPAEGMNFAYGFKTSAIAEDTLYPGGYQPSSLSTWLGGGNGFIVGGNAAFNTLTLAKGNSTVAFNINTTSYGTGTAAFGMGTSAMGYMTIATGLSTIADGILSQAHGQYTSANGILSYVYGGFAQAGSDAHGSFTFGSPYIYGTGSGSTTIYFPTYTKRRWDGSSVQTITATASPETIDKYTKTYNDGMGAFVFGQGTSALSNALQSFVVGICNTTDAQGTSILGNKNTISTNSSFSSVLGGKNIITNSPYSQTNGFFNTITTSESGYVRGIANSATSSYNSFIDGVNNSISGSENSYVAGSDNILTTSVNYSTILGNRNNITNSNNATVVGNNNTVTGTYVGVFGNKSYVFNSTDSYAIGNNTQLLSVSNSLALGYGAVVSANDMIQVGSCAVSSVNIQSQNITLDAKTCRTGTPKTKILLRADEIELDGYSGNIERYRFDLAYGRERTVDVVSSVLKIKMLKLRRDVNSGAVDSVYLKVTTDGTNYVCSLMTDKNKIFVVKETLKALTCIMINPLTLEWYFGENNNNIVERISLGYRLLVMAPNNGNVLMSRSVNFYAFNELGGIHIYTYSNDDPAGNIDYLIGSGYNETQQLTSDTTLYFIGRGVTKISDGGQSSDSQIQFIARDGDGQFLVKNNGEGVRAKGQTATLYNGRIATINTEKQVTDGMSYNFGAINNTALNIMLEKNWGWNDLLLV